jgi:hypothetical protein
MTRDNSAITVSFIVTETCFCTIPNYPLRWGQTSLTEGIGETEAFAFATLHPNPTTGQIHIGLDLDGDFTVQVFDSHGKLVMTTHNTQIITLEGMAPGLFHIVVEKDGHRWSRRIIKM